MSVDVLGRPFKIIAFDWDGTAVVDRQEDATPVRERLDRVLERGVYVVVITGTNFPNVDRQLSSRIVGPHKQRLFVCANRGSEVYGFDADSRPVLIWKRVATPRENRLLTGIAEAVRQTVERRTGLPIRVIRNRLNRRKIDVIPVPEWANPAKSEIGALLTAVERRLAGGGLSAGLHEVFDLTVQVAREKGLPDVRVTTDVKHVEVGLTDKGDSIDWMMRHVAAAHGIAARDVLIGGDEFGPIAGFEGSDARMMVPVAHGAVFVSVGPEPNGVPSGVLHLGGGPTCFRSLLDEQVALRQRGHTDFRSPPDHPGSPSPGLWTPEVEAASAQAVRPDPLSSEPGWFLLEDHYQPAREREVESLFAIANGYVGTRGSVHEHAPLAEPATFVAGIYTQRSSGQDLVVAPDWAEFRIFVEDEEVRLDRGETREHRRLLDMRRGLFEHTWRFADAAGRVTRLWFRRLVSLADRHALVETVFLTPENYSARIAVESVLDGSVADAAFAHYVAEGPNQYPASSLGRSSETPRTGGPTLIDVGKVGEGHEPPGSATTIVQSERSIVAVQHAVGDAVLVFGARSAFRAPGSIDVDHRVVEGDRWVGERWEWDAEIGVTYRVDKLVSVYTSRDGANPSDLVEAHLPTLVARGADRLIEEHAAAWADRWKSASVEIGADDDIQRAIRFAAYHLIAVSNPVDERVSIGARGLSGAAYKGHVFWDTEIYMLPYFTHTHPPSARALLMYRYRTLPGARQKAQALGFRGALYPWESTDSGDEASPSWVVLPDGEMIRIVTGDLEHHISADVAYGVWQYWRATGDDSFFREAGAEILLETARFWASRVRLGDDNYYHIEKIIGPDEYHESVDDDAYTNAMACWNLKRGADTVQTLRERWPDRWRALADQIEIAVEEADGWHTVAEKMHTGLDPTTGLIEQFRGYFHLDDIDLSAYEPRTAPIDLILGRERVARSQIIKQPDVVLLMHLLWDSFAPEVRIANFRYYEPRCAHGSSLSPSIHALVAAGLRDQTLAERYLRQSAEIDLANNMGNAAGGVHLAAMGGLWQATIFGLAGMRRRNDGLAFDPCLLPSWRSLGFAAQWRNRVLQVLVSAEPPTVDVRLERGEPMSVFAGENGARRTMVEAGRTYRAERKDGLWRAWREVVR